MTFHLKWRLLQFLQYAFHFLYGGGGGSVGNNILRGGPNTYLFPALSASGPGRSEVFRPPTRQNT